MKYILQVFSGPWNQANRRAEEIIRTIREIASQIPVEKVIIGWHTDPSEYRKTGEFLHESGIRMLLWLPFQLFLGIFALLQIAPAEYMIKKGIIKDVDGTKPMDDVFNAIVKILGA